MEPNVRDRAEEGVSEKSRSTRSMSYMEPVTETGDDIGEAL
jgi:hypothetical protein